MEQDFQPEDQLPEIVVEDFVDAQQDDSQTSAGDVSDLGLPPMHCHG
jgi:hypothetical protein